MPRRSKVYDLPAELRDELNAQLVANGFQHYEQLADWLVARGHQIGKSALHRYGQDMQEEFEAAMSDVKKATELARAWVSGDADEQAALVDANARIAQESLLRILMELRKAEHEPEKAAKHIAQVTRALADLGRVSLSQKKWAREIRGELARELEGKVDAQSAAGKQLTADAFKQMIREAYGG